MCCGYIRTTHKNRWITPLTAEQSINQPHFKIVGVINKIHLIWVPFLITLNVVKEELHIMCEWQILLDSVDSLKRHLPRGLNEDSIMHTGPKKKDRPVRNHSPVRGFQIIVQLHTSSMEVLFITSWLLKIAIDKVIFHGYECVLRFLIVLGLVEYLIILLVSGHTLPSE